MLESGDIRLHPLTFTQRELWECSPVPPEDAANNICAMIHLRGPLTEKGSEAALQKVVDRQDAFRLSFLPGKGQPLQMVRRTGVASLPFRDLGEVERTKEGVEARARELFDEAFPLVQGPLYRAAVLRRSAEDHTLVFAIHHAVADGWTLGVFVQDLFAAYLQVVRGIRDPLPPMPMTYAEWGASERACWTPSELEKRLGYWRGHLSGAGRLWDQAPQGSLHRWVRMIPAELAKEVREIARRQGATLFTTLLTAFQIALWGWSGKEDIVVGTPVANRNGAALREVMGYCAGVVPLRGQVDAKRGFAGSVKAVHHSTLDSFANAMPFAELSSALGESARPGHHPIFQVRFALQNHPVPDIDMAGISLRLRMRSTGTARFDLGCEVTEEGGALELVWIFREAMFPRAELERLHDLYLGVLKRAVHSPEALAGTLLD